MPGSKFVSMCATTEHIVPLQLPIPVSLIGTGEKHPSYGTCYKHFGKKSFRKWGWEAQSWVMQDMRSTLSQDPAQGGVSHEHDGKYPSTQRAVFGQKGFICGIKSCIQKKIHF